MRKGSYVKAVESFANTKLQPLDSTCISGGNSGGTTQIQSSTLPMSLQGATIDEAMSEITKRACSTKNSKSK